MPAQLSAALGLTRVEAVAVAPFQAGVAELGPALGADHGIARPVLGHCDAAGRARPRALQQELPGPQLPVQCLPLGLCLGLQDLQLSVLQATDLVVGPLPAHGTETRRALPASNKAHVLLQREAHTVGALWAMDAVLLLQAVPLRVQSRVLLGRADLLPHCADPLHLQDRHHVLTRRVWAHGFRIGLVPRSHPGGQAGRAEAVRSAAEGYEVGLGGSLPADGALQGGRRVLAAKRPSEQACGQRGHRFQQGAPRPDSSAAEGPVLPAKASVCSCTSLCKQSGQCRRRG
mmetsp:Transcript_53468/g.148167  ORF Transcript_53468/g.148167 Transcript_53468/m.148167 type:complete len:288 (+) Transcript_53468:376-1239(+)